MRGTLLDDHLSEFHSLQHITYKNGTMEENFVIQQRNFLNTQPYLITTTSRDLIEQARSISDNIPKYVCESVDIRSEQPLNIPNEHKDLIWFVTPRQTILKIINDFEQNQQYDRIPVPFHPKPNNE